MEQDLAQRIVLIVVYTLILIPVIRWRSRTVKIELSNGIPPLTLRNVIIRGLGFAIAIGSSGGIIGVFLGMKYDIPIGRVIWGSIYGAILAFILGVILFPLAQLFYERSGMIPYRLETAKRVPPIRSVTALTQGGLAFLSAFLTSLAITFLMRGEINWKGSFLVGLGVFIGYFIFLILMRITMKEEV